MIYTLSYDNQTVEKTFADWGFKNAEIVYTTHCEDVLTFEEDALIDVDSTILNIVNGVPPDGDGFNPAVNQSTVVVYRYNDDMTGKTCIFSGLLIDVETIGSPRTEGRRYTVSGPFGYLQNTVYMQQRNTWDNVAKEKVIAYTSHLFLNVTSDGIYLNTGQQIHDVFHYLGTVLGLPIQDDQTNYPALNIFVDEIKELSCAEVVIRMLRWSPDSVMWFDYTTSPPTFRCARRATMAVNNLSLAVPTSSGATQAQPTIGEVNIKPRGDLVRYEVVLKYEVNNVSDGTLYVSIFTDAWPVNATGQRPKSLVNTIDLQGYQATHLQMDIVTQPIKSNDSSPANVVAWWGDREPWLADPDLTNSPVITPVARTGTLPNELLSGSIATWMKDGSGNPINAAKELIQASCLASATTTTATKENSKKSQLQANVMTTDAETGTYGTWNISSYGEPIPVGLAKDIFDAVNFVQYEGTFKINEQDCSGLVQMGQVVNILNGKTLSGPERSDWSDMNSIVTQISMNLDRGETTVKIGPVGFLKAPDLIALLRMNRRTILINNPASLQTAEATNNPSTTLPNKLPLGATTRDIGSYDVHSVTTPGIPFATNGGFQALAQPTSQYAPGNPAGKILIDVTKATSLGDQPVDLGIVDGIVPGSTKPLNMSLKRVQICMTDDNGLQQHRWMIIPCSDMYKLPTDPPDQM